MKPENGLQLSARTLLKQKAFKPELCRKVTAHVKTDGRSVADCTPRDIPTLTSIVSDANICARTLITNFIHYELFEIELYPIRTFPLRFFVLANLILYEFHPIRTSAYKHLLTSIFTLEPYVCELLSGYRSQQWAGSIPSRTYLT